MAFILGVGVRRFRGRLPRRRAISELARAAQMKNGTPIADQGQPPFSNASTTAVTVTLIRYKCR